MYQEFHMPGRTVAREMIEKRGEDAGVALGNNAVDTEYENLPQLAREATKKDVLNIMGCILAGTNMAGCKEFVDYLKEEGGREEATIINYGGKVPATNAGWANSTFARNWDQEDAHIPEMCHCGFQTVPTAVTMAEREGKNGKDVITAVALGNDVRIRLRRARRFEKFGPLFLPQAIGSAVVAGKLLGLTKEQMANALGFAYTYGDSPRWPSLRREEIREGIWAKFGIESALLAKKGISGPRKILEGRFGYYRLLLDDEVYPEKVTAELGKVFEGVNLSIKPHPGAHSCQNATCATLEIVRRDNIKPEDVEEITIRGNEATTRHIVTPGDYLDLQIALAVVKREITIAELAKAEPDPAVAEIARKVRAFTDPEIVRIQPEGVGPVIVEVRTKDGRIHSERVDYFRGHHTKSPLSLDELADKFRRNAAYAVKPVPAKNVEQAIEMLCNLEQVDDLSSIVRLLG